jgi:hypothetical protein
MIIHFDKLNRREVIDLISAHIAHDDSINELVKGLLNTARNMLAGDMTDEKIVSALKACEERLRADGETSHDGYIGPGYLPIQNNDPGHRAVWCAVEGQKLVAEGQREKAMRWLGFVQGVTFALRRATIEELKNDSRPDKTEDRT